MRVESARALAVLGGRRISIRSGLGVAVLTSALLALSGCGANSWPSNIEANFLNACEVQGNRSSCECALSSLKGSMTANEFEAAETAATQSGTLDSRITNAIASCKK